MKLLSTLTLLAICFTTTGQTFPSKMNLTFYPGTYIDTEYWYADPTGLSLIIQNSIPKWGGMLFSDTVSSGYAYRDALGNKFRCMIFWSRIINKTDSLLELSLHIPVDSFAIKALSGAYQKIFLPPDTMTLDKEVALNYGLTNLKSYLDSNFYTRAELKRTLNPRESCMVYIVVMDYYRDGTKSQTVRQTRAKLELKGRELFYDINLHNSGLIPIGKVTYK